MMNGVKNPLFKIKMKCPDCGSWMIGPNGTKKSRNKRVESFICKNPECLKEGREKGLKKARQLIVTTSQEYKELIQVKLKALDEDLLKDGAKNKTIAKKYSVSPSEISALRREIETAIEKHRRLDSLVKMDKIIEIGIVELDINMEEKKILFNSPIYEKGVEAFEENDIFSKIDIAYEEVIKAPPLESFQKTLQLIFNSYRVAAFNTNFDLTFLENRGFSFPKKLKDIMKHVREILPKTRKYNFQDAYHYMYNLKENIGGNYLNDPDYIQQHQAIDDAIYEAELLYFLYYEFNYPLDYLREITDIINKSYTNILKHNDILNCNQNDNKLSCSSKNRNKKRSNKKDLF